MFSKISILSLDYPLFASGHSGFYDWNGRSIQCTFLSRSRRLEVLVLEDIVRTSLIDCPETEDLVQFTHRSGIQGQDGLSRSFSAFRFQNGMSAHYDGIMARSFRVNGSDWDPLSGLNDAAFQADRESVFSRTKSEDSVRDLIAKICPAVVDTIKNKYGTKFKRLCAQYHALTLRALTEGWAFSNLV
ncbi:hypothetical protein FOZ62_024560 [Perkinsus olseni]|uniref:Uncharacterized protein n=1 Tax=Perkinsus olseni TaxID=32597 RepID=A0A7J6RIA4_PEROL|nr:hypothetical protein FOZ62_024560 [Perkinsus olseni]